MSSDEHWNRIIALEQREAERDAHLKTLTEQVNLITAALNAQVQGATQEASGEPPKRVLQDRDGNWQAFYTLPDGGAMSVGYDGDGYHIEIKPRGGTRMRHAFARKDDGR